VTPATIKDDLRGRDFTCNAIALSLNKASRGLLLDPMNGLADIERHELRAATAYGFYDDPSRLLRLVRFRVRLGFTVEERTQMQVANARDAGVEKTISPRALAEELRRIGAEDNPADILRALGEAGLLTLFSPALAGPKINLPGITKFERISRLLPDDARSRTARLGPFLWALTEKLTPKEKQSLIATTDMPKTQVDAWQKLEARAKKLETALRAARIKKASQVYHLVSPAAPEEVLFLLYHSALKPVQERLRNYYQKYLPAIQEITAEEWAALEGKAGTPRQHKAREEFIANCLDRRPPRKPETPETPDPAGTPGPVGAPGPAAAPVEPGVVRRPR
jgi:tRNA nucleotidyltransferase/poly(A) polymerase